MTMRGETPIPRPEQKGYRPDPVRHERPAVAPAQRETTAAERRDKRAADARLFVEAMVRAKGSVEATRSHVESRLEETRRRIDRLEAFDPVLQEEYEFLKAQSNALAGRPELPAAAPAPAERSRPAATVQSAPEPARTLTDRIRSAWTSLTSRLFGPPELKHVDTSSKTRYEQTWTDERKAQREPDRVRNVAAAQERAVQALETKVADDRARIDAVTKILSRRRAEPMPANVRARYVAEVQARQTSLRESERLLRIASARERTRQQKAAA